MNFFEDSNYPIRSFYKEKTDHIHHHQKQGRKPNSALVDLGVFFVVGTQIKERKENIYKGTTRNHMSCGCGGN